MFTLPFLCGAAAAFLVFVFFLGEELDRRRETDLVGPWTPVFLSLYALGLIMLLVSLFFCLTAPCVNVRARRIASRWRRQEAAALPGVAAALADADERENQEAATASSIAFADGIAMFIFWSLFLGLLRAIVYALERSDHLAADRRSPYLVAEVLFCALVSVFVWLTVAGMAATYNEYRFNGVGTRCLALFGCCTAAYRDASAKSANIQADKNTHSVTALRKMYAERQPYQNNKIVWLCAPGVLPYGGVNITHILLLLLNVLALLAAGVLLFVRLSQIGTVQAELIGTFTSQAVAAATTALPAFAAAGAWVAGSDWPDIGELRNHVVYSLADWRGRVMPLAVVFIPLFIGQSLLVLWALPQAATYWLRGTPLAHWVQGAVYIATLAMLILFEALLSARVDDGTLAAASWHATLAPLYAALLFALAVLPLSIFCAPPGRSAVAAQSYCGLVVA